MLQSAVTARAKKPARKDRLFVKTHVRDGLSKKEGDGHERHPCRRMQNTSGSDMGQSFGTHTCSDRTLQFTALGWTLSGNIAPRCA